LHSRNRDFSLNQFHFTAAVTNSALYEARAPTRGRVGAMPQGGNFGEKKV